MKSSAAIPFLCRNYGWVLALTGHLDTAALYLDCAEHASRDDDLQLGQVLVAQAYLAGRNHGDTRRRGSSSRIRPWN